jgi:putative Holliday junction resolvase
MQKLTHQNIADRILGLDVGTKRIGIAVSDPLKITAQPLKALLRKPENISIQEIKNICEEYNVSLIVVGLPKNMDGTTGFQAEDVLLYVKLIKEKILLEVELEDERLTSKMAETALIEMNKKPSRKKELVDVASAILILQMYLDRRR